MAAPLPPAHALGAAVVVALDGAGVPSTPRHAAKVVAVTRLWGMWLYRIAPAHPERSGFLPEADLLPATPHTPAGA